jgi:hypothetical protein
MSQGLAHPSLHFRQVLKMVDGFAPVYFDLGGDASPLPQTLSTLLSVFRSENRKTAASAAYPSAALRSSRGRKRRPLTWLTTSRT